VGVAANAADARRNTSVFITAMLPFARLEVVPPRGFSRMGD
jgi:hypothetical protein